MEVKILEGATGRRLQALPLTLNKNSRASIWLSLGTGVLRLPGAARRVPGLGLPQPPTAPHGVPWGLARPGHPYNPVSGWGTPEALHSYHGYQMLQGRVKPFPQHSPAALTGLCQNFLVQVRQGGRAS